MDCNLAVNLERSPTQCRDWNSLYASLTSVPTNFFMRPFQYVYYNIKYQPYIHVVVEEITKHDLITEFVVGRKS